MRAETWAEQDLDEYLKRYAEGSDETERRSRTCAICGETFDCEDGKAIELCIGSPIRINGHRPDYICLCSFCYITANSIGEDEYNE